MTKIYVESYGLERAGQPLVGVYVHATTPDEAFELARAKLSEMGHHPVLIESMKISANRNSKEDYEALMSADRR